LLTAFGFSQTAPQKGLDKIIKVIQISNITLAVIAIVIYIVYLRAIVRMTEENKIIKEKNQ